MYISVSITNEITVVPWTIIQQEDDVSFGSLFLRIKSGCFTTIVPTEYLARAELDKVFVGQTKESLNVVERDHSILGPLSSISSNSTTTSNDTAALQLYPSLLSNVRNRKDKLRNCIVEFCMKNTFSWQQPDKYGYQFITDLTNLFWYIDGHHHVFSSRSCPIPPFFSQFTGYNMPELSKHRKRSISNMSRDKLLEFTSIMQEHATSSWMDQPHWATFKMSFQALIESLSSYVSYLSIRNKAMKLNHSSLSPAVHFSDATTVRYLKKSLIPLSPLVCQLDTTVSESRTYEKIHVNDFCPKDKRKKYLYIRELEKGLSSPVFFLTYSHHSNVGNYYFVWKAPEDVSLDACTSENTRLINDIQKEIPSYHTRAMRQEFCNLYGRISPNTKSFVLRSIYRCLTDEKSASRTTAEEEIDKRIIEALSMEDPDIVLDLRELNTNGQDRYSVFWAKCDEYLSSCTSVQERRHGSVVFMAKAISIRDLVQEVIKLCPPDTPTPSLSWVQFNFCPRHPHSSAAKRYTGRLGAKHMVQKRQFRKTHPDAHFCAAIFRYMRDYAVRYRSISVFVCIDDKHRIKVGEPGYPVAATERGRQVIVSKEDVFAVGDHDFTKFSLIPSVILLVDIPETMEGSWYRGEVFVGLKEASFEPSSPIRHATELSQCLSTRMDGRHILFIYSDGGPDHRLTFLSVQLSLIALFLNLNVDVLIAGRTAPCHSWANPVERIMSIVNLGIQSVGIMRKEMGEKFEECVKKCKTLKEIREGCSSFKDDITGSLNEPKDLLASILIRLELKNKKFQVFQSASEKEIEEFWNVLLTVDSAITKNDTTQKSLEKLKLLQNYITHCCQFHKYSLTIRKCGKDDCSLCHPIKMPSEVFQSIHNLPNPVMNEDGHYCSFDEVYGTETVEELPSSHKTQKKTIPFNVTQQHVKNVNLVIQCEECQMWRLIFSKRKLNTDVVLKLEKIIEDISYTCGATFCDINLQEGMESICIREHSCNDPIEKLYYSCGFEPICIYCSSDLLEEDDGVHYPQCNSCGEKPKIKKVKRRKV